jgi:hypothetical protein
MKLVTVAALVVLGCASTQGASQPQQGSAGSTGRPQSEASQATGTGGGADQASCQSDLDCPVGACVEHYCRKY